MINRLFTCAAVALLGFSTLSTATTVTYGTLTYDDTTDLITDSVSGTQYLGWDVVKDLTYAETDTATQAGGAYAGFHIASQTEAYSFYNALGGKAVSEAEKYIGDYTDGDFGDSFSTDFDFAFFLSDEVTEVGILTLVDDGDLSFASISPNAMSFAESDKYALTGIEAANPIGWLLTSDNQVSAVPIPAALFMFAPALLGLLGFRRKMQG